MTLDPSTHLVFVDIETTGLEPKTCAPLEIGMAIVDHDLFVVDRKTYLVHRTSLGRWKDVPVEQFVHAMHHESGLWEDLDKGLPYVDDYADEVVDSLLHEWLVQHFGYQVGKTVIAGNSVQFDRKFLEAYFPVTNAFLHYRQVDQSGLREFCKRVLGAQYEWKLPKDRKLHRVNPDLDDSIALARFHRDLLVHTGG